MRGHRHLYPGIDILNVHFFINFYLIAAIIRNVKMMFPQEEAAMMKKKTVTKRRTTIKKRGIGKSLKGRKTKRGR